MLISTLHRPSRFDYVYVYVMQYGRIADQGTFADLRERSSLSGELWHHQKEVTALTQCFYSQNCQRTEKHTLLSILPRKIAQAATRLSAGRTTS